MIKIEVSTTNNVITVTSEVKATRVDLVAEIESILKNLETNYRCELALAMDSRIKEDIDG